MSNMNDNNIKNCREELEMTQEELGFVFGVSASTVSGWENGHDTIPLNKLIKFSNLYGYSLDYLTGLTRNKKFHEKINKIDKLSIGKNLLIIRKHLNLSQQQIANECMISQTTYSNYETGQYLITTLTLYTICYNHHLSIYDIIK